MSIPTITIDQLPNPLPEGLAVVDVREEQEWVTGHIEGATHIPLSTVPVRTQDLPEGQILVVCKVGGRSGQATMWLAANGYDVVNLDGGMLDWAAAGRPMVSDTGTEPYVS